MFKIRKKTISVMVIIIVLVIMISILTYKKISSIVIAKESNKYRIIVDVEVSELYLLENGELARIYKCSGGKPSTPSPIGTWTIISKGKWGEGFGGSWMGFDVPWGKFGIHGTLEKYSIGWASSHGCIRMDNAEVAELYKIIPIGTKVTIIDGVYGPFGKGFRDLKSGMYGSDVKQIQEKLKELGLFHGVANGKFGPETENAVQNYCKKNNLYVRKTISIDLQKHMGFMLMD